MEVDLVWKSTWNFMNGLYFFQRYLPFIDTVLRILYCKSDAFSIFLRSLFRSPHWRKFDEDYMSKFILRHWRFVKLTCSILAHNEMLFPVMMSIGFGVSESRFYFSSRFESYWLLSNSDPHTKDVGLVESKPDLDHYSSNSPRASLGFRFSRHLHIVQFHYVWAFRSHTWLSTWFFRASWWSAICGIREVFPNSCRQESCDFMGSTDSLGYT